MSDADHTLLDGGETAGTKRGRRESLPSLREYATEDVPATLVPIAAGLTFASALSTVTLGAYQPAPTALACVGAAAVGALADRVFVGRDG